MQVTVKTGDTLIHPVHGKMKVTNVNPSAYEEYINAEEGYQEGYRIEAVFNRFIPGVKWTATDGNGKRVSKLIFHSWYLRNLKRG